MTSDSLAVHDDLTQDEARRRLCGEGYGSLHLSAAVMSRFPSHVQREQLSRALREANDDLQRAIRCRAFAASR